ncbi:SLBB domain-containing protein [Curtobacterium sp. ISL-83]|uniref:SLBB domain-containing protein n=1 Tax=Curtobacterium sp. ISL-83 TaxID=2819145 RepID=UPI002035DEA2|nr:SLBB domain-containing protein [Curtobacterium sp. ISL-83]
MSSPWPPSGPSSRSSVSQPVPGPLAGGGSFGDDGSFGDVVGLGGAVAGGPEERVEVVLPGALHDLLPAALGAGAPLVAGPVGSGAGAAAAGEPVTSGLSGRLALSPRAAVVLGGVVLAIALVVVALGAGSSGAGGDGVVVTGAPTVTASGETPRPASPGAADGPARSAAPTAAATAPATVVVHVLGAVAHAGVVDLPVGSRVQDALTRAGGAVAEADLTRLNLARVLEDGERLYVPRVGEAEVPQALGPVSGGAGTTGSSTSASGAAGAPGGAGTAGAPTGVVDLNTADQAALETLPGIGPSLAVGSSRGVTSTVGSEPWRTCST